MLPEAVASALDRMGVRVSDAALLGGGISRNVNWSATWVSPGEPDRKVVIKLCREKTGDALCQYVSAVNAASIGSAPTPRVLAHSIPDGVIVLDWACGSVCDSDDLPDAHLAPVGRALALLHKVDPPPSAPLVIDAGCSMLCELEPTARIWAGNTGLPACCRSFARFALSELASLPPISSFSSPAPGHRLSLLHCDVFPDNVVVDGQSVTLIDMEETCVAWRVLDIGAALMGVALLPLSSADLDGLDEEAGLPQSVSDAWLGQMHRVRAVIEAYGEVALPPLTDEEKRAVPDAARMAALALAFWRFRAFNWPNEAAEERQRKRYLEMLLRCRFVAQFAHLFI